MKNIIGFNRYIGIEPQEFKVVGYSVKKDDKCNIKLSTNDTALNIQHHLIWTPQLVVV